MGVFIFRYEPQSQGMDESRRKEALERIKTELLKKLQKLDTDIIFSTGWCLFMHERPVISVIYSIYLNLFISPLPRPRVWDRGELYFRGDGN